MSKDSGPIPRKPRSRKPKTDTPSTRTARRRSSQARSRRPATTEPAAPAEETTVRRAPMLPRVLVLLVVLALIFLSYGTTVRVYFQQQRQMASYRQEIAEYEESIMELEERIERWGDDEYVKTQARERLGWVLPGEVGYRVVDANGDLITGGQEIGEAQLPEGEYERTWWDKMWGSVRAADDPTAIEDGEPPR